MTAIHTHRLVLLGRAKRLTQAQLPFGMIECEDPTDRWGI